MIANIKIFLTVSVLGRLIYAGLLFWALDSHSYGYYTLLRWVALLACGYCLMLAFSKKDTRWAWTFGVLGLLFNPIFPVSMDKNTWAIVDAITGIVLIASIFFIREADNKK